MTRSSIRFPLVFAALFAAACTAAPAAPSVWIHAGSQGFHAEVADTPAARARGLKGRKALAADAAMLFVFDTVSEHCFWMKGTPLPLSVAFLADDGTIVGIADMVPNTSKLHCSPEPVRFALEVRQGGFRDKGLHAGARFSGGPFRRPRAGSDGNDR